MSLSKVLEKQLIFYGFSSNLGNDIITIMTMRTVYKVKCSCGHIGEIKLSENDAPYSAPWERYNLHNLNGGSELYVEGTANIDEVFTKLNIHCPKCNSKLNSSQINN